MLICGIEEAGRGPVIGPMVMAAVCMHEKDLKLIQDTGAKDSKQLTPRKREEIFEKIIKTAYSYKIIIVSPREIDEALESPNLNLNWLEAITSAKLINSQNPDSVILDCPSNNLQAYKEYLMQFLNNKSIPIIAEHKADENYPIVGAASILAKVTRDKEIEKLRNKIKIDFGSGYPADPKTNKFLKENYNKFPEIFRKSWSSYKKVLNQSNLSQF
ncbi:ribonuclease HII [Candidatus Woesearchaeota archaeon]|nr:ribonuclease HII [Candidatus Woesearchaeota archaeon]